MNFKRCLFLRVVVEHVWHGSEVVANALAQWYFDLLTFSYFTRNAGERTQKQQGRENDALNFSHCNGYCESVVDI